MIDLLDGVSTQHQSLKRRIAEYAENGNDGTDCLFSSKSENVDVVTLFEIVRIFVCEKKELAVLGIFLFTQFYLILTNYSIEVPAVIKN